MAKLKEKKLCVDVSEHNGVIDWEKLKQEGIEYAVIRSSLGTIREDKYLQRNVDECNRLGIQYGLYHYSYYGWEAPNDETRDEYLAAQALEEAEYFFSVARKYEDTITLPLFVDIEDKVTLALSDKELWEGYTKQIDYLTYRNFLAGIYASKSVLRNRLDKSYNPQIGPVIGMCDIWVADWGSNTGEPTWDKSDYEMPYKLWQYTSNKKIDGKRFDMNYIYEDYVQEKINTLANGQWRNECEFDREAKGWVKLTKIKRPLQLLGMKHPLWFFKEDDNSYARGWKAGKDKKWYYMSKGIPFMVRGYVEGIDGANYYFEDKDGYMLTSTWVDTGNGLTFFLPNGKQPNSNYSYTIDGTKYGFNPLGIRSTDPISTNFPPDPDFKENIVINGKTYIPYTYTEKEEEEENKPVTPPTPKYYKISFEIEPEGVIILPDDITVKGGTVFNKLELPKMKEGYYFNGWYYNGELISSLLVDRDITLLGRIVKIEEEKKKYRVTFVKKDDLDYNLPEDTTVEEGQVIKITFPSITVPKGYHIEYWELKVGERTTLHDENSSVEIKITDKDVEISPVVAKDKEEEVAPPAEEDATVVVGILQRIINFLKKIISLITGK